MRHEMLTQYAPAITVDQLDDHELLRALPQDLAEMTDEQDAAIVRFFAALPLADLRHRQALCELQLAAAFKDRDEHAMRQLHVMEDQLTRAVLMQHFGELAPRPSAL